MVSQVFRSFKNDFRTIFEYYTKNTPWCEPWSASNRWYIGIY